jgi:mono/diheme cytochrome c family protein
MECSGIFRLSLRVAAVSFLLIGSGTVANSLANHGGAARPDPAGWYTTAQAASGAKSYQKKCASCHGAKLQGGMAPALVGKQFWTAYGGKKLSTLWPTVHTEMPMTAPGSVSPTDSVNIMAYILQKNGMAAGTVPLDDTVDLTKVLPAK